MNTTKNIHQVSAALFFVLGFAYLFLGIAFRNELQLATVVFWMRILDIPFALLSLLYASTGFYLQSSKRTVKDRLWYNLVFAACILLFALVVFINLSLPSRF